MCFSVAFFIHWLIVLIIICGALALLKLLIGFVAPKLGVGGEVLAFVAQAFTIVLWVVICIAAAIFIGGLIGCLTGGGLSLPIPR